MTLTPWDVLASAVTKLGDKIAAAPEMREATVVATSPLTVMFDTDATPVVVKGALDWALAPGLRVMTLKLRHYVWVLGAKQEVGNSRSLGTANLNDIIYTGDYHQVTVANATLANNYPAAGTAGKLEVINAQNSTQIYQRFTQRPDSSPVSQGEWIRGRFNGVWRPWTIVTPQDTGWVTTGLWTALTGWSMTGYQARKQGNEVFIRFINFTRTGTALNGAMGDIGNTLAASLSNSDWAPTIGTFQLYAGNSGRVATGYIDGNGAIGFSAVAAGLTDSSGVIPTNGNFSLSGGYKIN